MTRNAVFSDRIAPNRPAKARSHRSHPGGFVAETDNDDTEEP